MLARANRVVRPADFRAIVRRGKRFSTQHTVLYVLERADQGAVRFGFVVGKNVGGAVSRNLVRRRLREASREVIRRGVVGRDFVVRALPGSAEIGWVTLQGELDTAIGRSVRRS